MFLKSSRCDSDSSGIWEPFILMNSDVLGSIEKKEIGKTQKRNPSESSLNPMPLSICDQLLVAS